LTSQKTTSFEKKGFDLPVFHRKCLFLKMDDLDGLDDFDLDDLGVSVGLDDLAGFTFWTRLEKIDLQKGSYLRGFGHW
jgi:hypothetical protein